MDYLPIYVIFFSGDHKRLIKQFVFDIISTYFICLALYWARQNKSIRLEITHNRFI